MEMENGSNDQNEVTKKRLSSSLTFGTGSLPASLQCLVQETPEDEEAEEGQQNVEAYSPHSEAEKPSSPSVEESSSDGLRSSDSSEDEETRHKSSRDMAKLACQQPDLYGVRRSGRNRQQVVRYEAADSDEEKVRPGSRTRRKRSSQSFENSDDDSSSNSSHFSDGYTRRSTLTSKSSHHRKSRGKRGRKKRMLSDSDEYDSDDYRRVSVRATGQPTKSYKEDSDTCTDSDDIVEYTEAQAAAEDAKNDAETIDKVLKKRIGRPGAVGSSTIRYNVEEAGDPNEDSGLGEKTQPQYLIKWKGFSRIHNTWESETSLREIKPNGMKKLENFVRKQDDLERWKRGASREDVEYMECQDEMAEELNEANLQIDRVVAASVHKGDDGFHEYLVKWQGLPYSEASWESGQLLHNRYKDHVQRFTARNRSQCIPTSAKLCRVLQARPKFHRVHEQPSYFGDDVTLRLRDYQLDGVNWLLHSWCKKNSVILADEMGLGKTIQTIAFLSYLMHQHQLYGPFLLVVPLSTIASWQTEFDKWAPDINVVVYVGDQVSRNRIREYEWCHAGNKRIKLNVVLTTYEILLKDKAFLGGVSWAVLGVDEAHRLKNDDSLLYRSLFTFHTNQRLLITGTPLQNTLRELWALLHFCMPAKFDDWEEFNERHSTEDSKGVAMLHKELEPFLLRRVKKDVEKSLPAKTEQILRVEMSKSQRQYYKWILTKNYKALQKGVKGSFSSFLNIVMELKKCCNHAYLIRPADAEDTLPKDPLEAVVKSSGKLILLDKLLLRLRADGHRVLIFSQMVRMLDIIADYLQLRRFQYQRLDGTIRGDLRKQAMDHFNAPNSSDFCFLLSTRAGGLGVNLASADTVIIFDSDWNPQNDLQAQARAHRIGQTKQVSVYRFVIKDSVEEDIIERAKRKMVLDHLVIQRMDTTGRTVLHRSTPKDTANPFNKDELNAILKFGAEDLFKKEDDGEEEDEPQMDLDDILNRAETRNAEEESTGKGADELMNAFKVVSFENMEHEELERPDEGKDWDDIIPAEDRLKMEERERQEALLQLNLPPRMRKPVLEGATQDADAEAEAAKSNRPKTYKKGVKGFTVVELRRFIKSFRKFPRPHERLEAVASDAELLEKSQADLRRVSDLLREGMRSAKQRHEDARSSGGEAPTKEHFMLASIAVNPKQLWQAAEELEPLAAVLPTGAADRARWQLAGSTKDAHWAPCEWGIDDDSRLLRGIYEYGMGNWEQIKLDTELGLTEKLLPDEAERKPQKQHLQLRAAYLLRLLSKWQDGSRKLSKPKKARKKKEASPLDVEKDDAKDAKVKSERFVEDSDDSDSGDDVKKEKKVKKKSLPEDLIHGQKKEVFEKCKTKMRDVKRSMSKLRGHHGDDPQINSKHLLKVGDHIAKILKAYSDPDTIKEWRSHLWKFVQNFGKKEPGELEALYTRKSKRRRELNERQGEREKGEKHEKHAEKRGEEGAKKERTEKHKHKKDKEKSEESKRKRGNFSESSNEAKEHKFRPEKAPVRDRYDNAYNRLPNGAPLHRGGGGGHGNGRPHERAWGGRREEWTDDRHGDRKRRSDGPHFDRRPAKDPRLHGDGAHPRHHDNHHYPRSTYDGDQRHSYSDPRRGAYSADHVAETRHGSVLPARPLGGGKPHSPHNLPLSRSQEEFPLRPDSKSFL